MNFTPVLTATGILRGLRLTLIIGVLAGLYPALRAARLNIAQTLREQSRFRNGSDTVAVSMTNVTSFV